MGRIVPVPAVTGRARNPMQVCPLVFEPIYKPRVWGGRRMRHQLARAIVDAAGSPIGESWEISDLPGNESRVARGPERGKGVRELLSAWREDLVGRAPLIDGRFPLLLKFLDAGEPLSVQVHPDAAMAARRGGDVRIKNEAWYVIDADPGAAIHRGVRPGVGRNELQLALRAGAVDDVLLRLPARRGHAYYLPSGTVHALGAGILVAEVQTPSDTTYRLFDWGRTDRELHIDDGLACASLDPVPENSERPEHTASVWTSVTSLVRCESFVMERVRMVEGVEQAFAYGEMVIWMVLEGHGRIVAAGLDEPFPFSVGDTVLLPAALKDGRVITDSRCMWLEITVPISSSLAGFERPTREELILKPDTHFVDLRLPPRS